MAKIHHSGDGRAKDVDIYLLLKYRFYLGCINSNETNSSSCIKRGQAFVDDCCCFKTAVNLIATAECEASKSLYPMIIESVPYRILVPFYPAENNAII